MKQYYFKDGKLKTITCEKITNSYIYGGKSVYTNNIGKTYKTKKLATRAYVRDLKSEIKYVENLNKIQIIENANLIKKLNGLIRKWGKGT